jgi:predicted lipoprotein with Yx(FWY)xxD motif
MRNRVSAATAVTEVLLSAALAGCGTSTAPGSAYGVSSVNAMASVSASASSGPATSRQSASGRSSAVLTIRKTPIGYVLADANGYTIYWYARDPQGGSRPACAGRCLLTWFPVTGKPTAVKGGRLHAVLGSITRSTGQVQATYNGYPLYTFGSDSAPGMTNGNGSGGSWHVIKEKAPS